MTIIVYRGKFKVKYKRTGKKSPGLLKSPQARGNVARVVICTPRKPNSARRMVAKATIYKSLRFLWIGGWKAMKRVTSRLPGKGIPLKKYSVTLIRGGGARDLPGVGYTCIRGVYDFSGVTGKVRRRSIYGLKKPEAQKKKIRRKTRISLGLSIY